MFICEKIQSIRMKAGGLALHRQMGLATVCCSRVASGLLLGSEAPFVVPDRKLLSSFFLSVYLLILNQGCHIQRNDKTRFVPPCDLTGASVVKACSVDTSALSCTPGEDMCIECYD